MRVKSVPRHKLIRNRDSTVIRSCHRASDPVEDSPSEDEKHESLKCRLYAPGASDKYQTHPLRSTFLDHDGGNLKSPPCCSESNSGGPIMPDANNNTWFAHSSRIDSSPMAGSSGLNSTAFPTNGDSYCSSLIDNTMEMALNLSIKDRPRSTTDSPPSSATTNREDKMKDTFLYKIMTDPMFLESIQRNKQPKKFPCQFCKQEFANGNELYMHLDVKKDESNQVVCCACKKTFAQKRYLRYHQRCHSERTKFTCDICTKKYTRLDNLTRHNVFHVNPGKFSCGSCEKTFARKDLLNKHQKCHDNKYRFFCEACQKYFKGPLTLENHKKVFHPAAGNAAA